MTNRMKGVSFIIPVYNSAEFLPDCINELLQPKVLDYEIILVDDGSQDKSGSICDFYARNNSNIKVYHQANRGVSAARNYGLKIAVKDFIIFLDADDIVEIEKIEDAINIMTNNDAVDLLIFGMSFDYYANGKMYRQDNMYYPYEGMLSIEQWINNLYELYINNSISSLCNKVFRKDIITANNLVLNNQMFLYEDLEFVVQYMSCCTDIYTSKEIIYHYRQTENEGNLRRRLMRIEHVTQIISPIEKAFSKIESLKQCNKECRLQINHILVHLSLVLAEGKIACSNVRELIKLCEDMNQWLSNKYLEVDKIFSERRIKYLDAIKNKKIVWLIVDKRLMTIRRFLALRVKRTKFYKVVSTKVLGKEP